MNDAVKDIIGLCGCDWFSFYDQHADMGRQDLVSLALKYWSQQTAVNRNLASNSYNMYLAHYLFVIVFQLVLFTVQGMPGLLKFGIVSVLSIMCTYIVCQFMLKPFPRISVVLVISLITVMILVIHP